MINKINLFAINNITSRNIQNNQVSFTRSCKTDTFQKKETEIKAAALEKSKLLTKEARLAAQKSKAIFSKFKKMEKISTEDYKQTKKILEVGKKSDFNRNMRLDHNSIAGFIDTPNGKALLETYITTGKVIRIVEFNPETLEISAIKYGPQKTPDGEKFRSIFTFRGGELISIGKNVEIRTDDSTISEETYFTIDNFVSYVKDEKSTPKDSESFKQAYIFLDNKLFEYQENMKKTAQDEETIEKEFIYNNGNMVIAQLNGVYREMGLDRTYGECYYFSNDKINGYMSNVKEGKGPTKFDLCYKITDGKFRKANYL